MKISEMKGDEIKLGRKEEEEGRGKGGGGGVKEEREGEKTWLEEWQTILMLV